MIYSFGGRVDNDSNAITVLDEENETAVTTGYVNGEYVEFSGGGGGTSDFSTAEVVINSALETIQNISTVKVMDGEHAALITGISIPMLGSSVTFSVPLYKGLCVWSTTSEWKYTVSTTGDITYDNGLFMISGDGTITIS